MIWNITIKEGNIPTYYKKTCIHGVKQIDK